MGNMSADMLPHDQEIFAPVAQLYPFDTEEQVIEMANNSDVDLTSTRRISDECGE